MKVLSAKGFRVVGVELEKEVAALCFSGFEEPLGFFGEYLLGFGTEEIVWVMRDFSHDIENENEKKDCNHTTNITKVWDFVKGLLLERKQLANLTRH